MPIFFAILSLIDIFVGGIVFLNTGFIFKTLIRYLAFFSISKGAWSLLSSTAFGYYFDWMGAIDLITGIALVLINFDIALSSYGIIGTVAVLKGVYSLLLSI